MHTAIVTGASSGIGRATAAALAAAGWAVVLTARRAPALEETAAMCAPGPTLVVSGDITDEAFVDTLFAAAVERFGRVDLLFNNAGAGAPQVPIEEQPLAALRAVLEVNVVAPWLCTRAAVRVFKAQTPPGGRIINNGSISAHTPRPHSAPYTASKHALAGLTKATALDGRAHGITCTQLDIGNAHTPLAARLADGALQPDGRVVPEATFAVRHVADAVVHLAALPRDVAVLEYTIMAAQAPYVGRG